MQNRKLITIIGAAALVGAIGVGSTLAYFTDTTSTSNIVTMGHVDIDLTENKVVYNGETNQYEQLTGLENITSEGLEFEHVVPGEVIPKNPTVTVSDASEDCYIRVKLFINTDTDGDGDTEESRLTADELAALQANIDAAIDTTIWNKVVWDSDNGVITYYCNDLLKAGDVRTLFGEVEIPATWGNNTADQKFNIELEAAAIQADNISVGNGSTDTIRMNNAGEITSWSDTAVEVYKSDLD